MPDSRIDAITDSIEELSVMWLNLAVAAKSADSPRDTVTILDEGISRLQAKTTSITAALLRLPTKDIAIDLHTGLAPMKGSTK